MIGKQVLNFKHAVLGGIFLLSCLHAEETVASSNKPSSQAYLSSLESKIEDMRYQLQVQQRQNARIEESLTQMKQFSSEIQALKDTLRNGSSEDLLTLVQKINHLDQQKSELMQSQQELLASINEKATKIDVDHSLHEITAQITQIKSSLDLRPSTLQVDKIEQVLSQAERDVKQLKLDFQEVTKQKIKSEEIEKSFALLSSQITDMNQYLEKVHVASAAQVDKMQVIEQQQQALSRKEIPAIQDKGWRAYAEFLYWQNIEPHLSYAVREILPSDAADLDNALVSILGSIKSVKFNWDPGFRMGAGYRWGVDSWDLSFEYTRFVNKGSDAHTRDPSGSVAPYEYLQGMFPAFFGSNIYKVQSKANLTYNIWDLALQRPFYETSSVVMRFLMGLRGASIHQNWHSTYLEPVANSHSQYITNKWDFNGGGPRAGFDLEWLWKYGLGFHFQTSGGLILGWFENKQTIHQEALILPVNYIDKIGKIHPQNRRIIPTIEILLGLQWDYRWDRYGVFLFADWEFNSWIDLNETYYFPFSAYNNNKVGSWMKESVSLQGLTTGVRFEF